MQSEELRRLVKMLADAPDEVNREQAEDRVLELAERKSKLVEKEWKRLVEMNQVITAERGYALVMAIVSVVREVVKDRAQLNTISQRLGAIVGPANGQAPGGGVAGV